MLVPYAGLLFLLLVGWMLTDRFVRALNEFESLNTDLERRVEQKSVELARQLEETRAARDAAEAADRAKSRFLAAASHDLRQPLHALQLFSARLGDRTRDAEEASLVQRIQTSVASLESLFSALLDISKLEAGVVTAHPRAIALESVFARIANDFAEEALDKGLSLVVRPTPLAAWSDPVLLERIVRNLVANAIRYTRHGGVLVGARRHGGRVAIEIWDSGPGIEPSQRQRVFEEFYQVGNPERDRTRGLGLGLAIVRRLAALHDHEVDMQSRPGRGSVFRVLAKAMPAAAAQPAPQAAGFDIANPLAGKRIVVVDDEEPVREAMRQTLAAWSSDPIVAGDVDEAIARIGRGGAPDALVVDYRLRGGRDGIDAVAQLRGVYGDVPAIVVSGESSTEHLARITRSGLVLLHKPVAPAKLRAALAFAIGQGGVSGEARRAASNRESTPDSDAPTTLHAQAAQGGGGGGLTR
jgi:signal transduction histidine kinase/DNA-binding NarL/FixJ family response regulator